MEEIKLTVNEFLDFLKTNEENVASIENVEILRDKGGFLKDIKINLKNKNNAERYIEDMVDNGFAIQSETVENKARNLAIELSKRFFNY